MEGEKDCILANQLGLTAITGICGAGTFHTIWKPLLADKDIVLCYDVDTAGRNGVATFIQNAGKVARSIRNVILPLDEPYNADFTDYIKAGNTVQDFLALVDKTPVEQRPSDAVVDIPAEVTHASLDAADKNELLYHRIVMNCRVIGGEMSPYVSPQEAVVTCNRDNNPGHCNRCNVGDNNQRLEKTFDELTPRLLDLIECSTDERHRVICDIFGIPSCKKFQLKELGHQSIYKYFIIPSIDEIKHDDETQNQTYVERELYYIGERLEINCDYCIEALAIPSPKDQSLILLGYKVRPADTSIAEFQMTPKLKSQLEIFQCVSTTK